MPKQVDITNWALEETTVEIFPVRNIPFANSSEKDNIAFRINYSKALKRKTVTTFVTFNEY